MPPSTHSIGQSRSVRFSSLHFHMADSVENHNLGKPLYGLGGSVVATKRMVPRPSASSDGRTF